MSKFFVSWMILFSFNCVASDFYQIKEKTIEGKEIKMEEFKGKVLLIVNVASQCGFTSQLESLEKIYLAHKSKGLVVIGVPTNDFGGQTPEDDKGFKEFCSKNYNVTFPMLTKKTILGNQKRELYKFLTEKSSKNFNGEVGWNFVKFLVNKEGKVVDRFTSYVKVDSDKVIKAISKQL